MQPTFDTDTDGALKRSDALGSQISEIMDGYQVPIGVAYDEAAGCFQLALEHHLATRLLVRQRLIGSAFSLNRLIYESAIRGLWLMGLDAADALAFRSNTKRPTTKTMVEEIDAGPIGSAAGVFLGRHAEIYGDLSDLTHAGPKHLSFRLGDGVISGRYSSEVVVGLLELADQHLNLVMIGWVNICDDSAVSERIATMLGIS